MSGEFSERPESPPPHQPDKDPAIPNDGWGPETGSGFEQHPPRDNDEILRKLGEIATAGARSELDDGWDSKPENGTSDEASP